MPIGPIGLKAQGSGQFIAVLPPPPSPLVQGDGMNAGRTRVVFGTSALQQQEPYP